MQPAALLPDLDRIDRLMEVAGLDVLVATSKYNVQYLLGGYRFIFFVAMDAIGHSRYLPQLLSACADLSARQQGSLGLYRQRDGGRGTCDAPVLACHGADRHLG